MIGKREAFEFLLARADIVRVVVNCARGAKIPQHIVERFDGVVALDMGLNLPVPIDNLVCDDEGLAGRFSFDRTPFDVFAPWGSIFAMLVSAEAQFVWMADSPGEKSASEPEKTPEKPARGGLRSV